MFESVRNSVARWIAPPRIAQPARVAELSPNGKRSRLISDFALNWGRDDVSGGEQVRMYQSAKQSRLTSGFATVQNTSADAELVTSLTALRSRSRALIRDASYAKRAGIIIVNNVIGSGIGLQARVMSSRNNLNTTVNDDIEAVFAKWSRAKTCHTGGALSFADLERFCMHNVFAAGEILVRMHPVSFGGSAVPFALEVIEPERIHDNDTTLIANMQAQLAATGSTIRMGVEVDPFNRATAYYIRRRHPGELQFGTGQRDEVDRIPASQMIHLRIVDRWPQTRGEPWMHAVIRKLNDIDGTTEAEIVAARGAACYMATIETEDPETPKGEPNSDGTEEIVLEPGTAQRLAGGEKFNFISPNRPNAALEPFLRFLLREMAAGAMVSYESLSRDYSQSNYSSSRLALLDDRDTWRMLQLWFIRSFRTAVHEMWLQQAILSRAIKSIPVEQYVADPDKFAAVRYKPRGWSWIDPTKEVEAYEKAVRCGFTTVTDVIEKTADGRDVEDVVQERDEELKLFAEKGIVLDTDPSAVPAKTAARPEPANVQGEPTPGGAAPVAATKPPARNVVNLTTRGE